MLKLYRLKNLLGFYPDRGSVHPQQHIKHYSNNIRMCQHFSKRSSTLLHDSDHLINIRKTLKKSSNLRRDDVKVAKILADLKGANWGQILPSLNAEQRAIKHESVFERAKQFRGVMTSSEVTPSSNSPITVCEPGQNKVTKFNFIRKRRYAIYSPTPQVKKCVITYTTKIM